MFGLPEAGLLLVMGIDQFLDMGRTATNVLGNSIATAVVARWERELGPETHGLVEPGACEQDSRVDPQASPAMGNRLGS
jgi:Na+/H+-dicarboxylate symporter